MSCDKLVFDLSQEVEGSPNIFIRKDWINILDNQNQNYQNNQSIIDTSQLANSNKYMSYREAYLAIPLLLSVRSSSLVAGEVIEDFSLGLKNWFGTIIHSMTLDYNGTTIVQQTPFCNLWNSFKLMTTLSWADVATMGPTIGFYPDTPDSFKYDTAVGNDTCLGIRNNDFTGLPSVTSDITQNLGNQLTPNAGGNIAMAYRCKWISYDSEAITGNGSTYNTFLGGVLPLGGGQSSQMSLIWKSNISNKFTGILNTPACTQVSIMATVYLKHLHSFFNMCPLLKGVFMKLTLNLNNSSCVIQYTDATTSLSVNSSTSYIGGTQPILVPSIDTSFIVTGMVGADHTFTYDLMVGARSYNAAVNNPANGYRQGNVATSVYLYVPAYTFNPTFEQAYLSNNIKQIKYTDIYQYQLIGANAIPAGNTFNNLITNGIANIKSVLICPFYAENTGVAGNLIGYLSPFDTAGGGTVAPMATISNFNVQISGQNAIYNMQKYTFEEWNNQLYGQNAVNGGLTDGLTSGLIDFFGFQTSYSYYYVNVERMLPVEQSVPKSVQILGQNLGALPLSLLIFIEYGVQVSIDVLTGARV
jgi:hypothetical protein